MDHVSKECRSRIMKQIHGKNTRPEILVRRQIRLLGAKYRLHGAKLPGKPDIVLASLKKAILVHGCFWHQHKKCSRTHMPKTRFSYWKPKLARNTIRDRKQREELRKLGWKALVVWECETAKPDKLSKLLSKFLKL